MRSPLSFSRLLLFLGAGFPLLSPTIMPAATRTWDGGDLANTNWNDATNWNPNTAPLAGDTLVFPAGVGAADQATNNNFAANTAFAGLVFQTGGYTVAGNAFDLSGTGIALTHEEAGTTTITPTIRLTNQGLTFDSGAKGILRTGAVNLNGNRLMLSGGGRVEINGNIVNSTGTPPLIKDGEGSAVLAGFNNFGGNIEVNEGTLFANGFVAGAGTLTVSTVATLAGSDGGVTKTTSISGTLSPGTPSDSTTRMEFDTLSFFGGPGLTKRVRLDIHGDVAGDTHDQIRINDPFGLNAANLVLDFGTFVPPIGTVFTLIDNRWQGAIAGTFTGIAQNSQSVHDGILLRFSYTGGTGNDFTATVLNKPPVITVIPPQTTNEDTPIAPIPFTFSDAESPQNQLLFSVTTDNFTLLDLIVDGDGINFTITIVPKPDQFGTGNVEIMVCDNVNCTTSSFPVTVNPVDDPPAISEIASLTIPRNASTPELAFVVGDVDTPIGSLQIGGASGDTFLVLDTDIVVTGTGASRSVTVTPLPRRSGSATIHLFVSDGTTSITESFLLTVSPESALESWRLLHFGSAENTGDAANAFDFDHDGVPNLLEYAFALHPKEPDARSLPQPQRVGDDLVLSFLPPPDVSGVDYGAESSTSLAEGSWVPRPDFGPAPEMRFILPLGPEPENFIRLTVRER